MVRRAADRKNVNQSMGRNRAQDRPEFRWLQNERQAPLGAENAMNENDRICMSHGRRYAAPIPNTIRARGTHPGLKSPSPLRGSFPTSPEDLERVDLSRGAEKLTQKVQRSDQKCPTSSPEPRSGVFALSPGCKPRVIGSYKNPEPRSGDPYNLNSTRARSAICGISLTRAIAISLFCSVASAKATPSSWRSKPSSVIAVISGMACSATLRPSRKSE